MVIRMLGLWKELILVDLLLHRNEYPCLYNRIRTYPVMNMGRESESIEATCEAVNRACIWYPQPVLCLARSALTVYALRRHGFVAQLVVGVQVVPFRMHAWVELDSRVVNDHSYVRESFTVLDRY